MRMVNFEINNVRVGQITNYDELILTLETDGTINGRDAIEQSAKILLSHFALFANMNVEDAMTPVLDTAVDEGIRTPEADDLKSLGLSNRSYNALIKNDIKTISELRAVGHDQLMTTEGLGEKSVIEIEKLLSEYAAS
jgi:DNA-directed RNA polymerase subunit alpha